MGKVAEHANTAAERAKSVVDAFIDTTGIGSNGQVQAAMRTADGKVQVVVDNPLADQKIAAIAQVAEDDHHDLRRHSETISRDHAEIERLRQELRQLKEKRNCCCVIC